MLSLTEINNAVKQGEEDGYTWKKSKDRSQQSFFSLKTTTAKKRKRKICEKFCNNEQLIAS